MPKAKILILGLGMQGKAALYDLCQYSDFEKITVADANSETAQAIEPYLTNGICWENLDVMNERHLVDLIRKADIIIDALPSQYALTIGKLAAGYGVHLVSSMYYKNPAVNEPEKIAYIEQEIEEIDYLAEKNGCTILTEFGLDPGLDLIIGKQNIGEVEEVIEFHSYGAGLPPIEFCNNPIKYKFSWSIIGVMHAYVRPAKIITEGQVKEIDGSEMFAPENTHTIDLDEIGGVVECFYNGNVVNYSKLFGIRDSVKEMGRYTCRRPGHQAFWETLVKCGFLNTNPIKVGNNSVVPIEFTAALFESQDQFFYAENEQDIAFIRTDVRGISKGKRTRVIYQIVDKRDLQTGFTAMQRTVGFTMSIGAQLILDGKGSRSGILYPFDVPLQLIAPELEKRNILITRQELDW
jgi:saccharopine dehydrogenase-like NADP-dependent oxidoreductase